MNAQRCLFCRSKVSLIDSARVFGCSYGFIYLCNAYPQCDARVSCYPGTIKPLGTLADKELRRWRRLAHQKFDPLWNMGIFPCRNAAYIWLSKVMRLPLERTHIAMFNIRQCQRAITCIEAFKVSRRSAKTKVKTYC